MRATPGCITWGRIDGRLVAVAVQTATSGPTSPRPMTDDEKAEAVRRCEAGESYGQIAAALGTSRNAVAGVIFRAKQAGKQIERPIVRRSPAPRAPRPRPGLVMASLQEGAPYTPLSVSFADLATHHCRWPLWSNDAAPSVKRYCGNPVQPGQSYCSHCCSLSYSPAYTREIDRKLNLKSFARRVA